MSVVCIYGSFNTGVFSKYIKVVILNIMQLNRIIGVITVKDGSFICTNINWIIIYGNSYQNYTLFINFIKGCMIWTTKSREVPTCAFYTRQPFVMDVCREHGEFSILKDFR